MKRLHTWDSVCVCVRAWVSVCTCGGEGAEGETCECDGRNRGALLQELRFAYDPRTPTAYSHL